MRHAPCLSTEIDRELTNFFYNRQTVGNGRRAKSEPLLLGQRNYAAAGNDVNLDAAID